DNRRRPVRGAPLCRTSLLAADLRRIPEEAYAESAVRCADRRYGAAELRDYRTVHDRLGPPLLNVHLRVLDRCGVLRADPLGKLEGDLRRIVCAGICL